MDGITLAQNQVGGIRRNSNFCGRFLAYRLHFYHYHPKDTGWYYLQSRYYDPIVKRFLNADEFASTGQGFLGCNMFAYCNNNPIIFYDNSGCIAIVDDLLVAGCFLIATTFVCYLYSPAGQASLEQLGELCADAYDSVSSAITSLVHAPPLSEKID